MFAAGGGDNAGPSATRTTIGLTTFIARIRPIGRTALMRITDHDDLHDVRRLLRRMAVLDPAPHRVNSAHPRQSLSLSLLIFAS
jgi:hypothetical protein